MTVRNDVLSLGLSLSFFVTAGPVMAAELRRHDLGSTEIEAIRSRVVDGLRDPDSAKLRNLIAADIGNGELLFCGEINAKNALGGYVGYQRFWGQGAGKITIADSPEVRQMTDLLCKAVETAK